MLIANSNLVPHWATWEHFNELDRKGLMMYGQMTAGSWIYIGSQGIVQGTYETFVEAGRQHYGGDLAGRWILTAGLGGMGGAQPLAATMAGARMLAIECQRVAHRLPPAHAATSTSRPATLDEALALHRRRRAPKARRCRSACSATPPRSCPSWSRAASRPTLVTDQTSAHDPVNGYLPTGWTVRAVATRSAPSRPGAGRAEAARVHGACTCRPCSTSRRMGIPTVDYGNNIRQVALDEGVENAFDFPGFVPAYIRPLFCRGIGPFRWVALSGDPEDIYKTDAKVKELIPDDPHLHHWLDMARERISFQGLPARICWVGLGERAPRSAWPSTRWCAAAS